MRPLGPGSTARLLVVEDDELGRSLLVELLSDAGFQPDGARAGREALARLTSAE
jgi:CheY-like chemotaxis protein